MTVKVTVELRGGYEEEIEVSDLSERSLHGAYAQARRNAPLDTYHTVVSDTEDTDT